MTVSRVGSWSALASGDPTGTITIGAGSNRILMMVVSVETASVFSIATLEIGGQGFTDSFSASLIGTTTVVGHILIWDEDAIAAMSGSSVGNYTHAGVETGKNWQYATFQDVEDQDDPVEFSSASGLTVDSVDLDTESYTDGYIVALGIRNNPSREFDGWDSLTEIEDEDDGEGFRHGLADGVGGENETTILGDGTPAEMLTLSAVLAGTNFDFAFTGNGALSLGDSHIDNLEKLLSAFAGRLTYTAGQWRVIPSEWPGNSLFLTESDILKGSLKVRGSAPATDRINTVRGVFVDPARDYEAVEFPVTSRAAYVTRDGKTMEGELLLPMTNHGRMAQRLAYRMLDQANNQIIVECTLGPRALQVTTGDIVSLTFDELSWAQKTFRITEWRPRGDGFYDVIMIEDSSTAYDDPTAIDYEDLTKELIAEQDPVVPPPTSLTAEPAPQGILLRWTSPLRFTYDYIDIYRAADNAWASASLVYSSRGESWIDILEQGQEAYYWIRARQMNGEISDRFPGSDTSTITATAGTPGGDTFGSLGSKSLSHIVAAPSDANCGVRVNSSGTIDTRTGSGSWTTGETWIGSGANSAYECQMEHLSGDGFTVTAGTSWLACSTTRTWELEETDDGGNIAANSWRLRIRRTSDDYVGLSAPGTMRSDTTG